MSETFSILIDSRSRFETGQPGGEWLSMPTTTEQLHAAMKSVGITAENPQDFFINGFSNTEQYPFDVPLSVIQESTIDELNYLGKLLEMQGDEDRNKFTAAVTLGEHAGSVKDLINLAQNLDCYWIYPTVRTEADYGYYLIDELDELELPEEAKKYFKYEEYGRDAVLKDRGQFTDQGYIYNNGNTFSQWYNGRENDIPKEYKVMSFPEPEHPTPDKLEKDEAAPEQEEPQPGTQQEPPPQPRPVNPIILTADKPAEKIKEITDRLEQGITDLFDSERYKEYLQVMSKFHNYSFNNTLLIAMQKPDASLIAGFNAWKNNFGRNVMRGEKGIRILAPSPYKIRQEVEKKDPQTGKTVTDSNGKPVMETKEIQIPAYKVVAVFDVSQTEGRALRVGGNAAQCGSHRSGRTAVGVVIAKAEATAGLADVAAHSSKHHHHPMNLFAVLSTLDTPATHQHGALFAHQVSQALDSVSLYVANLFCPFGGLRHAIGLAEHIGDELVVTHGVLADEFAIHLTGSLDALYIQTVLK